jgi:aldose 1-epimerase
MFRRPAPAIWPATIAVAAMLVAGGTAAAKKKKADNTSGKPAAGAAAGAKEKMESKKWGEVDGKEVDLFTLTNKNGLYAKITNYGGIVTELHVPDRNGKLDDIVLGYDNLHDYLKKTPYFGASVGRVGNRIANAQFQLDGKTYKLAANNPPHHLHGGVKGWDKVVWKSELVETPDGPALKLTYVSPDGEEGYPGTVHATVVYTLTNDNEFRVVMSATTDKATPINMVHHSYWNLHGGTSGDVQDQVLTLYADKYTPGMPPGGKVVAVAGTPFDFRKPKAIGKDLKAAGSAGMDAPPGYDNNFIVNGDPHLLRPVAKVEDPKTGRVLSVVADQPGVQLYTGLFLDGSTKGKGRVHTQYSAFCLETQRFPNSINVPDWKTEVVLRPGQVYKHTMVHRFTTTPDLAIK